MWHTDWHYFGHDPGKIPDGWRAIGPWEPFSAGAIYEGPPGVSVGEAPAGAWSVVVYWRVQIERITPEGGRDED